MRGSGADGGEALDKGLRVLSLMEQQGVVPNVFSHNRLLYIAKSIVRSSIPPNILARLSRPPEFDAC